MGVYRTGVSAVLHQGGRAGGNQYQHHHGVGHRLAAFLAMLAPSAFVGTSSLSMGYQELPGTGYTGAGQRRQRQPNRVHVYVAGLKGRTWPASIRTSSSSRSRRPTSCTAAYGAIRSKWPRAACSRSPAQHGRPTSGRTISSFALLPARRRDSSPRPTSRCFRRRPIDSDRVDRHRVSNAAGRRRSGSACGRSRQSITANTIGDPNYVNFYAPSGLAINQDAGCFAQIIAGTGAWSAAKTIASNTATVHTILGHLGYHTGCDQHLHRAVAVFGDYAHRDGLRHQRRHRPRSPARRSRPQFPSANGEQDDSRAGRDRRRRGQLLPDALPARA